jgi:hypothetical protein
MNSKLKRCWILFTVLVALHAFVLCAYLAGSSEDLLYALESF